MSWISDYLSSFMSTPKQRTRFRDTCSVEKRKELARRITEQHPEKIPIIVDISNDKSSDSLTLMKSKYLATRDMTIGKFIYQIRQHIVDIDPTQAIYLYLDSNILPPCSSTIDQIYHRFKDPEDDLLYFTLSLENTFG